MQVIKTPYGTLDITKALWVDIWPPAHKSNKSSIVAGYSGGIQKSVECDDHPWIADAVSKGAMLGASLEIRKDGTVWPLRTKET